MRNCADEGDTTLLAGAMVGDGEALRPLKTLPVGLAMSLWNLVSSLVGLGRVLLVPVLVVLSMASPEFLAGLLRSGVEGWWWRRRWAGGGAFMMPACGMHGSKKLE